MLRVPHAHMATTTCPYLPWQQRLWPPPVLNTPRLPERLIVSLGRTEDYVFESAICHGHTNPTLFARTRAGQKVVMKLRLGDKGAREYAEHGRITIITENGNPDVAGDSSAHSRNVFSKQWARCSPSTCPTGALQLGGGGDLSRLRQVPAPSAELNRCVRGSIGRLRLGGRRCNMPGLTRGLSCCCAPQFANGSRSGLAPRRAVCPRAAVAWSVRAHQRWHEVKRTSALIIVRVIELRAVMVFD